MRNRGHVFDHADLEPCGLQCADGRLTAGARPLDKHFHTLEAVLHGGTGIPDADIRHAISMGIAKVNVGTEIRKAYVNALYQYTRENEKGDVRPFIKALRASVAGAAARYLENFTAPSLCSGAKEDEHGKSGS